MKTIEIKGISEESRKVAAEIGLLELAIINSNHYLCDVFNPLGISEIHLRIKQIHAAIQEMIIMSLNGDEKKFNDLKKFFEDHMNNFFECYEDLLKESIKSNKEKVKH